MEQQNQHSPEAKISPQFAARLDRLSPDEKVRAIVMLRTEAAGAPIVKRPSRASRRSVINTVRETAEAALPQIDSILARFDGQRLATTVDLLGSVPVETSVEGINALAASDHVKAIFEDQKVSLLSGSKCA